MRKLSKAEALLLFELGERRFALLAADVVEIVRAVAIRALPAAPRVVEGIFDLRGEIVPVLDVRSRFRLPARALRPSDHFVIARTAERKVALRVDRAIDLRELEALPLAEALNLPSGVHYLAGVATLEGELILIHDLRAFLSEAEQIALDAALPSAEPSPAGAA